MGNLFGMRNLSYIILLFCLTGLQACKKLTHFNMTVESDVTIASGNPLNFPFDVSTPPVTTNASATFENEDTRANLVDEISLKSCQLRITSPSGRDFSFLKSLHVFISTDKLPEKEIAFTDNIPDSVGSEITLQVPGGNIREYLVSSQIGMRIATTTDKIISGNTDMHITSVFAVKAKLK